MSTPANRFGCNKSGRNRDVFIDFYLIQMIAWVCSSSETGVFAFGQLNKLKFNRFILVSNKITHGILNEVKGSAAVAAVAYPFSCLLDRDTNIPNCCKRLHSNNEFKRRCFLWWEKSRTPIHLSCEPGAIQNVVGCHSVHLAKLRSNVRLIDELIHANTKYITATEL